jgi:arylsulfatase
VETLPGDFYSSKDFTNEIISYISEQEDNAPFFAFLAYTAPHDPLHVPDEYMDKYRGVYDNGYETIKKERLTKMKNMGIVDESVPHNPGTGKFPQWEDLDDEGKRSQARKMEIYAAMIENLDYYIGRLILELKNTGKYENTIIIFLSDNGSNPKEAVSYPGNSLEYLSENYDNRLENMGRSSSFVSQGGAWAEVSNTPFTYFKTTTGEGGIHSPLIIKGPGVTTGNLQTLTGMHVCDIFPTVLDMAGVSRPGDYKGNELAPLYGLSAKEFLSGNEDLVRNTTTDPLHFEMMENKAVIKGNWKALMLQPPYATEPGWQLFDLSTDPLEKHNLASVETDILNELITEWNNYAKEVGYIKGEGEMILFEMGPEKFYEYENPDK